MTTAWRVTKYDPAQRNSHGHYLAEDWTSVADVGRAVNGKVLTVEEYLRVEDAYIDTAMAFHADAGMPALFARDVEPGGEPPKIAGEVASVPPVEGKLIDRAELPVIIRSCLREIFWCCLETKEGEYRLHFGYDYYMYISGVKPTSDTQRRARAAGMFLEPFRSPYEERS